ncbi:MAG TPA: hypothetical protein VHO69_00835, partial [Phototrophicaceae bacterium]|nr:hypothetical protein [Phototrophicaceae bacterium]
ALNGLYDSARTADGQFATGYADIGHFVTAADIVAGERIVAEVRAAAGYVISEDAAFSLVAGRDVLTNPTQLLNLDKKGLYDGTNLIQMVEEQAFGLIIFRAQFYPPRLLRAIGDYYRPEERIVMNGFAYQLLRPKKRE